MTSAELRSLAKDMDSVHAVLNEASPEAAQYVAENGGRNPYAAAAVRRITERVREWARDTEDAELRAMRDGAVPR